MNQICAWERGRDPKRISLSPWPNLSTFKDSFFLNFGKSSWGFFFFFGLLCLIFLKIFRWFWFLYFFLGDLNLFFFIGKLECCLHLALRMESNGCWFWSVLVYSLTHPCNKKFIVTNKENVLSCFLKSMIWENSNGMPSKTEPKISGLFGLGLIRFW